MKLHVAFAAALALPSLGIAPLDAFAQSAPAAAPPAAVAPSVKPQALGGMPREQVDRIEAHITALHKQLRITPAQQAQWDQFAQVMRENARAMNQTFDERAARLASMNAADNMQSYAQMTEQHAQDVQKLAQAFQALYGTFSDEQKKNADSVFRVRAEHHAHG
jgi:septal ring factor EnvC (AmiA/AmiB activator)